MAGNGDMAAVRAQEPRAIGHWQHEFEIVAVNTERASDGIIHSEGKALTPVTPTGQCEGMFGVRAFLRGSYGRNPSPVPEPLQGDFL